jgi:hypothetical protein
MAMLLAFKLFRKNRVRTCILLVSVAVMSFLSALIFSLGVSVIASAERDRRRIDFEDYGRGQVFLAGSDSDIPLDGTELEVRSQIGGMLVTLKIDHTIPVDQINVGEQPLPYVYMDVSLPLAPLLTAVVLVACLFVSVPIVVFRSYYKQPIAALLRAE